MSATVYVALGFSVALLSLAALAWCIGYLVRSVGKLAESVAKLLPATGQFLGTVTDLREPQQPTAQVPNFDRAQVPWPTRQRERGLAPPPVDTTSETSFVGAPVNAGDRDMFDIEALEMIAQAQRPLSQRQAERPPGPPIEGER